MQTEKTKKPIGATANRKSKSKVAKLKKFLKRIQTLKFWHKSKCIVKQKRKSGDVTKWLFCLQKIKSKKNAQLEQTQNNQQWKQTYEAKKWKTIKIWRVRLSHKQNK